MSPRALVPLFVALVAVAPACSREAAPPGSSGAAPSGSATTQPAPAGGEAPQVGQPAPEFSLPGSDGKTHALSDHRGKEAVVVAWFPKAFTGG